MGIHYSTFLQFYKHGISELPFDKEHRGELSIYKGILNLYEMAIPNLGVISRGMIFYYFPVFI